MHFLLPSTMQHTVLPVEASDTISIDILYIIRFNVMCPCQHQMPPPLLKLKGSILLGVVLQSASTFFFWPKAETEAARRTVDPPSSTATKLRQPGHHGSNQVNKGVFAGFGVPSATSSANKQNLCINLACETTIYWEAGPCQWWFQMKSPKGHPSPGSLFHLAF